MAKPSKSPTDRAAARAESLKRLVSDPWRKAAALILAIALWMFLDSMLTKTQTVRCMLEVVAEDEHSPANQAVLEVTLPEKEWTAGRFLDLRTNEPIDQVTFTFEGSAAEIAKIQPEREVFSVRKIPQKGETHVEFDVGEIDVGELPRPIKMDPPDIKLEIEVNASLERTLSHEDVVVLYPANVGERAIVDKMSFTPVAVTLRGTQSNLAELVKQDQPFQVDLRNQPNPANDTEIKGEVRLRSEFSQGLKIECEPRIVQATIPLRPDFGPATEVTVPFELLTGTKFEDSDFDYPQEITVTIWASERLGNELAAVGPQQFASEYMWLEAKLPRDYDGSEEDITLTSRGLRFDEPHTDFREGQDYKVDIDVPTIRRRGNQ